MNRRAFAVVAATLLVLTLDACGRKGRPVAPEQRAPQAVLDLAAVVRESAIELTWTLPGRRADNSRVRDLGQARVFRLEDAGVGEPKPALLDDGRIAGYVELAAIRLDAPTAMVEGRRATYVDRQGLTLGRRYTYVILTSDAQGRISPPSLRVPVTFISAPEPPSNVTAAAGDAHVRLSWRAPDRLVDGSPLTGALSYEVLRGAAPDAPLEPLRPGPVAELGLSDRNLENDRTYRYAVRTVRVLAATTAYGPTSPVVAATPRDTTPPSAPTGLVAIPSQSEVRLSWTASPEPDVTGYIVYRRSANGLRARVGSTRAPTTVFIDPDVPRGRHGYVVTAIDAAALPNESAPSSEVQVAVP